MPSVHELCTMLVTLVLATHIIMLVSWYTSNAVTTPIQTYSHSCGGRVDPHEHLPARQSALQRYMQHLRRHSKTFVCENLFKNKSEEITNVQKYLKKHKNYFEPFSEDMFPNVTNNCDDFLNRRGYAESKFIDNSVFPIAFSILTHRNIEELERLLNVIYDRENIYCIHVDRKSSDDFKRAVQSLVRCFHNVFIATRLEKVFYEHFSRLRAEINCIEDLLQRHKSWTYYINLAATELPLKSNAELVTNLQELNHTNDIREVYGKRKLERFSYKHIVNKNGKLMRLNTLLSPPPGNLTITKGLAYGAFSREFVIFTMTNIIAKKFLHWSKDTHSPDEHYWATLNNLYHNTFLKSPGGYSGHPDTSGYISRLILWKSNSQRQRCHGVDLHNICVFGVGDLFLLKKSKQLFANKFDLTFDPVAYWCMEELARKKNRAC